MPRGSIRQKSFAGGELAPVFWGRDDVAKYSSGLRRMYNAFPIAAGAAMNRPGTRLATSRAGKDHSQAVWLVPFIYSELANQAYALEFGHLYVRFVVNGAYVAPDPAQYAAWAGATTYALGDWVTYAGVAYRSLQAANLNHQPDVSPTWWEASTVYELVSPYTAADLSRIQYAQQGDVISLTRPGYAPRELKRFAHSKWEFSTVSFDVPQSTNFWWIYDMCADPLQAADATHFARPWRWLLTTLERDARGFIFETAPKEVTHYHGGGIPPAKEVLPFERVVYPDKPVRISRYNNGGAIVIPDATAQIVAYLLYRGQGAKNFGFINESPGPESKEPWIYDDGQAPDYARGPPMARNPFKVYGLSGQVEVLLRTEEPACVAFFENRRAFASLGVGATPYRPSTLLLSRTDFYANFDEHTVTTDDDAVEITLASRLREEIRWLLGAHRLLVGTSSGVWAVGGAAGSPLSPISFDAKLQSEDGSSWLLPLVAGDEILYAEARGDSVRALAWDEQRQKFLAQPLSFFSEHLFFGYEIVHWAYQRKPYSIAWAVRSDGKLLSLTYLRALEAWGWAQHELADGGVAESICAIPEGDEDAVYLVVKRIIGGATKRYIERLTSRQISDARLGVFLDSSLSYDGRNAGATTITVTEIAAGGYDVAASVAVASSVAAFVAGDVGNDVILNPDGLETLDVDGVTVLDPGTICRLRITGFTDASHVTAEVITPAVPAVYRTTATTRWGLAKDEFSGLAHLEGKTVVALADGNVVSADAAGAPLVVAAGVITIPEPAAVVHVGLAYVSELELLDLGGSADSRGREKIVSRVFVELEKSRGLQVGQDFETLSLWDQREVQDGYGTVPLLTGRAEVLVAGEWTKHGRAAVRQADPLPCTVVAVTRDVEWGGS